MKMFGKKNCPDDGLVDLVNKQSLRLEELKKENERILRELDAYRAKEKEISETLAYAKKQAESITAEAKIKYALECERIKIYRQKWAQLAPSPNNKARLIESFDKTLDTLKECQIEMENMLANDFGENMQSYVKERERLREEPILNYRAIINESVRDTKVEGLNENDLEELLKQL